MNAAHKLAPNKRREAIVNLFAARIGRYWEAFGLSNARFRESESMDKQEMIDTIYRGVLGRPSDPTGARSWLERLDRVAPDAMISALIGSPEFKRRFIRQQITAGGSAAARELSGLLVHFQIGAILHPIRLTLVQSVLPKAQKVLDLGGASSTPKGALLEMGYPHAHDLTIIDLLLDKRMKKGPDVAAEIMHENTRVRYSYHSMADLSYFPDNEFDMVWSGQTFEHISEEEGAALFPQVRRVLKPGGVFALDTPNRTVTKLTIGDDVFIHAEHKIEYVFEDFLARFDHCGMERIKSLGMLDMPRSVANGCALIDELSSASLNDSPATSYCFYVEYHKPN